MDVVAMVCGDRRNVHQRFEQPRVAMTKKVGVFWIYEKRNRTANVEDTLVSTIRTGFVGVEQTGVGSARG